MVNVVPSNATTIPKTKTKFVCSKCTKTTTKLQFRISTKIKTKITFSARTTLIYNIVHACIYYL